MPLDADATRSIITTSTILGTLGAAWYTFYNTTIYDTLLPSLQAPGPDVSPRYQLKVWHDIDEREKKKGTALAMGSAASFLIAYGFQQSSNRQAYLPICAALLVSVIPYTSIIMKPITQRLEDRSVDDLTNNNVSTTSDFRKYGQLVLGRAAISAIVIALSSIGLAKARNI